MTFSIPRHAEYFYRAYMNWRAVVAYVRIEYVSVLVDEVWTLSRANVLLSVDPSIIEGGEEIQTSSLRVGQIREKATIQSLDTLMTELVEGRLSVGGKTYTLPQAEGIDVYLPWTSNEPEYYLPQVEVKNKRDLGLSSYIDTRRINAELRINATPFDGTVDLFSYFGFGTSGMLPHDQKIVVTLEPPLDLRLENCILSDNKLSIRVTKGRSLQKSEVRLGLRLFPNPALARRCQVAEKLIWSDTGDTNFEVGNLELQLEDCATVEVMLSAAGLTVRRHFVFDKAKSLNSRLRLHMVYDPNLDALKAKLFCPPEKSRNLEDGVATLLYLLGASTAKPPSDDAPDIIAETKGGRVALVECTTRVTDIRTKAGKLVNRRFLVQNGADGRNPVSADALAILIVNIPREQIINEQNFLVENQIVLLAKEDIQRALGNLEVPPDLDKEFVEAQEKLIQQQNLRTAYPASLSG